MSLTTYGRVVCACVLGPLVIGSLLTAALFFYWLCVAAYLLPGNKKPAAARVQGADSGRWDIQYVNPRVADIRAIGHIPGVPRWVSAVS